MANSKVFTNVTTKAQAFTGRTKLWKVLVHNTSGATSYVQIFDLLSANVTLGNTTPLASIPVENNTELQFELNHLCAIGVTHGATTAPTGGTASSAGVLVHYVYD